MRIHVITAANNIFVPPLCATIASVLKNITTPVSFYILQNGLTGESCKIIESMFAGSRCTVEFLQIDRHMFDVFDLEKTHTTVETAFRFSIVDLKPDLKKAIYLDCDLIVRADLRELWDIDIGDCYAGVIYDQFDVKSAGQKYFEMLDPERYFNAGVLVLNLERIRRDFRTSTFLELAIRNRDWMKLHDQDVLNLAFKSNLKFLPLRWNLITYYFEQIPRRLYLTRQEILDARKNPAIVHYSGRNKPWIYPRGIYAHPLAPLYFHYLAMTPYAEQAKTIMKKYGAWRCFCARMRFWWRRPVFFLRLRYWRARAERLVWKSYWKQERFTK